MSILHSDAYANYRPSWTVARPSGAAQEHPTSSAI